MGSKQNHILFITIWQFVAILYGYIVFFLGYGIFDDADSFIIGSIFFVISLIFMVLPIVTFTFAIVCYIKMLKKPHPNMMLTYTILECFNSLFMTIIWIFTTAIMSDIRSNFTGLIMIVDAILCSIVTNAIFIAITINKCVNYNKKYKALS